jgi:hypothetical protein
MTTENQTSAVEVDPLAMPASSAETGFPLLKPNKIYRLSVKSIDIVESENANLPPGSRNAKITLATTKEEVDTKDNTLYPGFPLTTYIQLYTHKGYTTDDGRSVKPRTVDDLRRDVGTFIKAVEGKTSATPLAVFRDNPDAFVGKLADCKVGISVDKSGKYGDSNSVRFVIPD